MFRYLYKIFCILFSLSLACSNPLKTLDAKHIQPHTSANKQKSIESTVQTLTHSHKLKDVVTPYTHISEASRYILYTIILTFDGICTLS